MRGFWEIDINDETEAAGAIEAAEFLGKADSEGGLVGFLWWGGTEAFPDDLRNEARKLEEAHTALLAAVDEWAAERGVER
jgi:hypothetical protein